jgi:hypothetical protein
VKNYTVEKALEFARVDVPHMRRVPGTDLYSVWYNNPVTGEETETIRTGKIAMRRIRQEMVVEQAARLCGGLDELRRGALRYMTNLELNAMNIMLRRRIRAARRRREPTPDDLKEWDDKRRLLQSARWHATRNANLAAQRLTPPPAPDAGKAMEIAARKIKSAHPNLAPHALQTLARWASGTI